MASTPPNNEAFLREVDDELRRDQIMGYWIKWGRWLVGAIVLGLAAFGGYLWWDHAQKTKAGVEGEQLAAALDSIEVGGLTAAKTKLDALEKSPNEGYRATAKIAAAAFHASGLMSGGHSGVDVSAAWSPTASWSSRSTCRKLTPGSDTERTLPAPNMAGRPWLK